MRRSITQMAKIIRRGHQAAPKQPMPNAVDIDASGQGVVTTRDELRQCQPAAACTLRYDRLTRLREDLQMIAWDRIAEPIVIATQIDAIVAPRINVGHAVHGCRVEKT